MTVFDKSKGWAAGILIVLLVSATAVTAAERLAVISPVANIRGGPSTRSDILWKVEKYYPFLVIKRDGHWIFFKDFEGDEGWIHDSLVGNVPTVITREPECNLRKGPGTRFDIIETVEAGIPFKVISHKGGWLQLEYADGSRSWIHKSLVW
jgi:SH3-like domain-containing protein